MEGLNLKRVNRLVVNEFLLNLTISTRKYQSSLLPCNLFTDIATQTSQYYFLNSKSVEEEQEVRNTLVIKPLRHPAFTKPVKNVFNA